MPIRDRGKIKWMPAHFMPEHRSMLKKMEKNQNFQQKPILDGYETEEMENNIHYAMEFALQVIVKVWRGGFYYDYKGRVNRLDGIHKKIYLQSEEIYIQQIHFDEIVSVEVEN